MRRSRHALAALAATVSVASCGWDGSDGGGFPIACTLQTANQFVHDMTLDWYLFYPQYLPDPVPDPAAFSHPQDLLDALTAPARVDGKDRYWSYVASYSAVMSYYAGGPSVGFGLSLQIRGGQLFVTQVIGGGAADDAGFLRGDEILAIHEGSTRVGDTPFTPDEVAYAVGPSGSGVTRTFDVIPAGAAQSVTRTMSKREYTLDPVPLHALLPRGDGVPPVGYVSLVTFITPAEDQLREAFATFQAAGVQDVIVDLRYNGGGLVDTAIVLANLLGGGRSTNDLMFRWYFNAAHLADTWDPQFFAPEAASVASLRIAFVTTDGSASASELVANVMEPYATVAIVGEKTYGKPVGQRGFVLGPCDLLLGLIAFGTENAQGDGAYFDGLPDAAGNFSGPLCPAADDLTHAMGDPLEASTAAALAFVDTGACPTAPVAAAPALRNSLLRTSAGAVNPVAADPTPAQREIAGLF